jgi:hypothetical protein
MEINSMTDDGPKSPEKGQGNPRPGVIEKKTLIIAVFLIAVFLIAIIAIPIIMRSPPDHGTGQSPVIKNFTQPETGVPAGRTSPIPKTPLQTVIPTTSEPITVQSTTALPVDFSIQTGVPANCGLTCRQLDAALTNAGYKTAHNVCITVSMHNSRNEIINLNGESSLNRCVGDIAGGQTINEPITINADCGSLATLCIGETLTLQTQIVSDEKTVRFPDQVISV